MRHTYIIFTFFLFGIIGCNNSSTTTTTTTTTTDSVKTQSKVNTQPVQSKLNETGTQKLMAVITNYYTLKNALVASKGDNANAAATQLATITDSLQAFLQKDAAAPVTIKPFLDTIINQSKIIAATKDESCERQRLAFGTLSSAMYGLLKNVDLKNARVYQEYSPMAFNEKGAHWLSDDSDIKNPYFGKKMLECGEVTDVIK